MADSHPAYEAHGHGDPRPTYIRVFIVLLVFTIMEYLYASFASARFSFLVLVLGLMIMAVIKAGFVGLYFMHLKYEGTWVFFLLVPAGMLATVLIVALCPDIAIRAFAEPPAAEEEDDAAITAPAPADATQVLVC